MANMSTKSVRNPALHGLQCDQDCVGQGLPSSASASYIQSRRPRWPLLWDTMKEAI
ncbi:hypothetical protein SKAU_G00067530 [Synaphobranchus kaupii]|uniref:Uncharacterized protein n=1 Tax=Synaphobranchus kaupii TaxID=118154 RepID=A0A9Q1JAZ7_SYNKA|nr:hypothetical protein SKAU_G00067530 [Synaphobranchus kaupii]